MATDIRQALSPSTDNKIALEYNGKQVSNTEVVSRHDAPQPPVLKYTGSEQGPFLVIGLDVDAPFPSAAILSPILHWIQSDLTASANGQLNSQAAVLASWVKPNPPPFSGPHKYPILLYKQPATFSADAFLKEHGGALPLYKRVRWNLEDFVKEYGLTELVAATYFQSN